MSKEAMKLALEALLSTYPTSADQYAREQDAITALREALAEQPAQQELVATGDTLFRQFMSEAEKAGVTHWPTLPAAQQEPVKVGRIAANVNGMVLRQEVMLYTDDYLPIGTAIYTSPPAHRKPLTDEEIVEVLGNLRENITGNVFLAFARAIEAAHNIKENT